jgi:hypothetical protein
LPENNKKKKEKEGGKEEFRYMHWKAKKITVCVSENFENFEKENSRKLSN